MAFDVMKDGARMGVAVAGNIDAYVSLTDSLVFRINSFLCSASPHSLSDCSAIVSMRNAFALGAL